MSNSSPVAQHEVTLLELVDRVLNKGVVLTGDVTLTVSGQPAGTTATLTSPAVAGGGSATLDVTTTSACGSCSRPWERSNVSTAAREVLYVYAFVLAPPEVPEAKGINEAAISAEGVDGLAVVVSRHDATPSGSDAAVLAHARVVDAVLGANDAVVPARFGAVYADEAALRADVAPRASELESALARVRDAVELGLRALAPQMEPAIARTGTEYMRARLDRRLHAPLARIARETTTTVGATPRLLFSAAYLVSRSDVRAFRAAVEQLQAAHQELGLVCTGPWPPYSFVTAEAHAP